MRKWIVRHWAYSYDSKFLFGMVGRHLRVVNTLMPLFCAAGLYNLLAPGFDVWQGLAFAPFLIIFFGGSKLFLGGAPKFEELDWEQQYQLLQKGQAPKDKEDLHQVYAKRYEEKYLGDEKFVEALRGLFPILVMVLTVILYMIFGVAEVGFEDQRFF